MKDLDIKDIWKGADSMDADAYAKPEIDKMIQSGSHSLIHKFVRTLVWEQWINLLVLTSLVVELFWAGEWIIGTGSLVVNVAFYVYYQKLKTNLRNEEIDTHVLAYLYRVQDIIRQFIRHYKIAAIVLGVLAMIAIYYLNEHNFYEERMDNESVMYGLILGVMAALPMTFYLIHLLYGKKAIKLKAMIRSLEAEESE
ncbi:MAG: hypothetical protein ABJF11_20210 [Reichenbachiella sp.]|uniref:hypothetical protein n=1 Tax=Reichenbachiella sp. TaxID=2184521 RepID=UPI00326675EF